MRVVITGYGVVSGAGVGKEALKEALWHNKRGIHECTVFSTDKLATKYFGQIKDIPETLNDRENPGQRLKWIIQKSVEEMLADAKLPVQEIAKLGVRCRLFFGSLLYSQPYYLAYCSKKSAGQEADVLCHINDYGDWLRDITGVRGSVATVCSSCASGTTAAGLALEQLRAGIIDVAVAGGADSLTLNTACGFNSLKSLSSGIANPFDEGRDGINIGECGAFFIFETLKHAKERGARIWAEVLGYGLGNDGYHITSPSPDGKGAYNTMKMAICDAGIVPEDIDYINAHGTGTILNDAMEIKAINSLFGSSAGAVRDVKVSSTKAILGHCMGASGAVELASIILALTEQKYIPMPGLRHAIKFDDNISMGTQANAMRVDKALSNSFAFAGNTASLIVGRFDEGAEAE